jgi:regulator of protease activity HflC (stomatin/prohibitin superfamily)
VKVLIVVAIVAAVVLLLVLGLAVRIVKQYEQGVLFRLGRVRGAREPGLRRINLDIREILDVTTVGRGWRSVWWS